MTSDNELRDRIARTIFNVRDDEFDLDEWDDLDSADRERYVCDAQAIIDELGLTVELRADRVMPSPDPLEFDCIQRVVGKWEKQ